MDTKLVFDIDARHNIFNKTCALKKWKYYDTKIGAAIQNKGPDDFYIRLVDESKIISDKIIEFEKKKSSLVTDETLISEVEFLLYKQTFDYNKSISEKITEYEKIYTTPNNTTMIPDIMELRGELYNINRHISIKISKFKNDKKNSIINNILINNDELELYKQLFDSNKLISNMLLKFDELEKQHSNNTLSGNDMVFNRSVLQFYEQKIVRTRLFTKNHDAFPDIIKHIDSKIGGEYESCYCCKYEENVTDMIINFNFIDKVGDVLLLVLGNDVNLKFKNSDETIDMELKNGHMMIMSKIYQHKYKHIFTKQSNKVILYFFSNFANVFNTKRKVVKQIKLNKKLVKQVKSRIIIG
jgi:hypothetical protein